MSTVSDKLDPYTAEAQNNDITPQQKILGEFIRSANEQVPERRIRSSHNTQVCVFCDAHFKGSRWADAFTRDDSVHT